MGQRLFHAVFSLCCNVGTPIERLLLIINVEDEGVQLMDGKRDDYIDDFLDLRETFRKLKEL